MIRSQMKVTSQQIRLSATDLSNHLACRHLTTLDLQVALGKRTEPDWAAPDLAVIIERGERHEREYLAHLCAQGLTVENLSRIPHKEEERLLAETLALMERGAEVIAQGALSDGEWFGRPDVLRRVAISSRVWEWSYEVADTKLARETKAATILQLSLYSDLLGKIQETMPEFLWVVPPGEGFAGEKYRVSEYAAYFTDTCGSVCARRWSWIRVRKHTRSRWSTATSADGFANVMPGGARTIICLWWRTSDGSRGISLKSGTPEPWRSWQRCRFL